MAFLLPLIVAALLLGLASGLLPGLHPNSMGAVLSRLMPGQEGLPVLLIILLGIRTAMEFLPSIFLGVPDADTQVSALPGQRMRMEGRAMEAVRVCALSVVLATAATLLLTPLALALLPPLFAVIEPLTAPLLVLAAAVLLTSERKPKKILMAAVVFGLAALLGAFTLRSPMPDPLFALFVGFFTLPSLLGAREAAGDAPKKKEDRPLGWDLLPPIFLGVALGALADLLPGISTPAQIAVFASLLAPMEDPRKFLALVASIATSHAGFAITAAASIGVARVGTVAMAHAITPIVPGSLVPLLGAFALAAGIGAAALLMVGRWMSAHFAAVDWPALGMLLAVYLAAMVLLSDGWMGLATLATATAIGMLPMRWGIRRTHVMGALIGPSIWRALAGVG